MILIATDQTKKYLCILSKQEVLKCFKVNNSQEFPFCIEKYLFNRGASCIQMRSFKKSVKRKNTKKEKSINYLYICLTISIKEIQIINTITRKLIYIKINNPIDSISFSILEIFIFSKKFIYLFDINSGELIKRIKLNKLLKQSEINMQPNVNISKNGLYLIIQTDFLIIVSIKFGYILKILKNNYGKIKLINIISSYRIILLLDSNLLKIWNTEKDSYKDLIRLFLTNKKLIIKSIKKIFLENNVLLFFLSENFLSFKSLILINNPEATSNHPLLISLYEKIESFETLVSKNSIIIICKNQKKITPFNLVINNLKIYLNLKKISQMKKNNNINYRLINSKDYFKKKKNIIEKIFKEKQKNIKKIRFIDIKFKLKHGDLALTEISSAITKDITCYLTKFKICEIFFKQLIYMDGNNVLKSLKYLDKHLIQPLLIFTLKKILQNKLSKYSHLMWIKQIIFYHFSHVSENFFVKHYLNEISLKISNNIDQKNLQNLLINICILKTQNDKYIQKNVFFRDKKNVASFYETKC
nr:hypothetical protein Cry52Nrm3_p106 [Cryptomonas curvata]